MDHYLPSIKKVPVTTVHLCKEDMVQFETVFHGLSAVSKASAPRQENSSGGITEYFVGMTKEND